MDRNSAEYHAVYNQRTVDGRVNSQALELGIERPELRRRSAITNPNTLIYVLINLRGLQRVRERKAHLAAPPAKEELAHQLKLPVAPCA